MADRTSPSERTAAADPASPDAGRTPESGSPNAPGRADTSPVDARPAIAEAAADPVPAASDDAAPDDETTAAEIVRRIGAGELAPASLSPDARRRCVEYLTLEGFTTSEIAEWLKTCERTVRRDRAAIRQDEALAPTLTLGDELMGELQRLTVASIARLTRLSSDPSVPPYARLWAEDAVTRVHTRFIDTARKLGYLRTGNARLTYLAQTDPDCQRQSRESVQAMLDNTGGIDKAILSALARTEAQDKRSDPLAHIPPRVRPLYEACSKIPGYMDGRKIPGVTGT